VNILLASPINAETIETLEDRHDVVRCCVAGEDVLQKVVQDRQVAIFRSGVTISGRMMDAAADLQLALAKTQKAIALEECRGPA